MLLPVRFLLIPDLCCFLYQVSKLRYYFQCIDFKIKVSERKCELDYKQLLFLPESGNVKRVCCRNYESTDVLQRVVD